MKSKVLVDLKDEVRRFQKKTMQPTFQATLRPGEWEAYTSKLRELEREDFVLREKKSRLSKIQVYTFGVDCSSIPGYTYYRTFYTDSEAVAKFVTSRLGSKYDTLSLFRAREFRLPSFKEEMLANYIDLPPASLSLWSM